VKKKFISATAVPVLHGFGVVGIWLQALDEMALDNTRNVNHLDLILPMADARRTSQYKFIAWKIDSSPARNMKLSSSSRLRNFATSPGAGIRLSVAT
jgi:hypothetical protein